MRDAARELADRLHLLRLAQLLLERVALGDVARDQRHAGGRARGVGHHGHGRLDRELRAVPAHMDDLEAERPGAPEVLERSGQLPASIGREDQLAHVTADRLFAPIAVDALGARVPALDEPVEPHRHDRVRRGLDQRGEAACDGLALDAVR